MWQAGDTAEAVRELRGSVARRRRRRGPLSSVLHSRSHRVLLTYLSDSWPTQRSPPRLTSLIHRVFGNIGDILGCVLGWTESEEAS